MAARSYRSMGSDASTSDVPEVQVAAQPYKLPEDSKTPVVVFDYEGGATRRQTNDPRLQILADGTVILGAPYGIRKRIESSISPAALQSLLKYILEDQRLGEFDAEAIEGTIKEKFAREQRFRPRMMDGATTIVRVNVDGTEREAKYYILGMAARQHPEIKALSRLQAVEQHLQRGIRAIYAGGAQKLNEYRAAVNAKLKAEQPTAEPFSKKDVLSALVRADGTFQMQLRRVEKLDDGKQLFTTATLNKAPGREPVIEVKVSN